MMLKKKESDPQAELKELNSQWKKEKPLIERQAEIEKEKEDILSYRKKATTTKKYMAFFFLTATVIEIFTGILMVWQMHIAEISVGAGYGVYTPDLTPQVTLITTVVSEVVALGIYSAKSYLETKSERGTYSERHPAGVQSVQEDYAG